MINSPISQQRHSGYVRRVSFQPAVQGHGCKATASAVQWWQRHSQVLHTTSNINHATVIKESVFELRQPAWADLDVTTILLALI